ncbi:hypothetical protein CHISP_1240 [Chitinispirillum alkaliphilum]|nr:hypothetical protein CHISP_1240 [Chitinispirillum alkaliphilum]
MIDTMKDHPTEEMLLEYALGEGSAEIKEHVRNCSDCMEYVREIARVKNVISSIGEEDVPPRVRERIFRKSKGGLRQTAQLKHPLRFPFVIGMLTMFVVLLLYYLYIYL